MARVISGILFARNVMVWGDIIKILITEGGILHLVVVEDVWIVVASAFKVQ